MAFCSNCGTQNDGTSFCNACGAAIAKSAVAQTLTQQTRSKSKSSASVLLWAGIVLVGFFLPWFGAFGFSGGSGYQLAQLGSYGNWLWSIPTLCVMTILVSMTGHENRLLGALTGLVPIGTIIYALGEVQARFGGSSGVNMVDLVSRVMGLGAWLTVLGALGLLVSAAQQTTESRSSASSPYSKYADFRRTNNNRWVGGVCGGLAKLTNTPLWMWRFLFTVCSIAGGSGLIIYALCWIFVPMDSNAQGGAMSSNSAGSYAEPAPTTSLISDEKLYYFLDAANQPQGPTSGAAIHAWVDIGRLKADVMVAGVGESEWIPFNRA